MKQFKYSELKTKLSLNLYKHLQNGAPRGAREMEIPPLFTKMSASTTSLATHIVTMVSGLGSNTYLYLYLNSKYLYLYLYLKNHKMKYLYLYLIGVFGCIWQIFFKYTFHFYTLIHNDNNNNNKYDILFIS